MRWLWTLVFLFACDDLNKPLGHPTSPNLPPEPSSSPDGGAMPEGGPATAPTITPQPGDIQI